MFADAAEIIGTLTKPQRWAAEAGRLAVWAVIAAALFLVPAAAQAQPSGSELARAEWAKIQDIEAQLTRLEAALSDFQPRRSYCRAPHPDDKSTDEAYLDSLKADAEAEIQGLNGVRAALMGLFSRDQKTKAAIDAIQRGAADSIVDGSFRRRADAIRAAIDRLYKAKRKALADAPTRFCGGGVPPAGVGTTGPGANVVRDPLAGAQLEPPAVAAGLPAIKRPFCTEDEKYQALAAVLAARVRAADDAMALDRFLGELRGLRGQIQRERAAIPAGQAAQARAHDAALARVGAAIARAEALLKSVDARQQQLDALLAEIRATPVVDCLGKDPLKDALSVPSQDLGPDIPGVGLKDVDIPAPIPDKFCSEEEKNAWVVRAAQAFSNAAANRGAWESRLMAVIDAQRSGKGDAAALQQAREEARTEHAKWKAIADKADAAFDAIMAVPVVDCEGEKKVGRVGLDTGAGAAAGAALGAAIGSNPAADNGMREGWGTVPDLGAFDGSEAERALEEALREAGKTHRVRHPRPQPQPQPEWPDETPAEDEHPLLPGAPGDLQVDPEPEDVPALLLPEPEPEERPTTDAAIDPREPEALELEALERGGLVQLPPAPLVLPAGPTERPSPASSMAGALAAAMGAK